MIFDTTRSDIILVSYPSGGFGNFIHNVLTNHVESTVKHPIEFEFSSNGNSHNTSHYCRIYYHDPVEYIPVLTTRITGRLVVLCDNGITNDSYTKINTIFPNSTILRVVIDHDVRPIVFQTSVIKASNSSVLAEVRDQVNANWVDSSEDYAVRENFTLMYHNWPHRWHPSGQPNVINLSLRSLILDPVTFFTQVADKLKTKLIDVDILSKLCVEWTRVNSKYFAIFFEWVNIQAALVNNTVYDLTHITDLHSQGYLNYCIEEKYNVVIPVYDYASWFINTTDILNAISKLTADSQNTIINNN